jgi:hypothetical protein
MDCGGSTTVANCIVSRAFLKHVLTLFLAKLKDVRRASFLLAILSALLVYGPSIATVAGNETPDSEFSGMVWERHGDWHLNGSSAMLRLGEAIPPGGLLTAGAGSGAHSIVILLPDGQRMLCECYDAQRCSQGFRVPAITPRPDPAVWNMFVAVRNVLLSRSATAEVAFPMTAGRAAMAANVEMVAAVSPQGEISITPALRVLPTGQYSLTVTTNGQPAAAAIPSAVQPLNWTSGQKVAQVRVGAPGLYRIRVSDQTNVPRIEVEVLATAPDSSATEAARLKQMRETIMQWNHIHGGWDLHDFLRAYLESRMAALSQG